MKDADVCKKLKKWIGNEQKLLYEYDEMALDLIKAGDGSGVVEVFSDMTIDARKHEKNLKKLYNKFC